MPSREDMVSQLQEAAGALVLCGMDDLAEILKQRAAQVENMRCETCKKKVNKSFPPFNLCPYVGCGGCFAHEQKPAG